MLELKKIDKVLTNKLISQKNIRRYNILVLDALVGQNSLRQVEEFQRYLQIDGLIMNKLDSTSKGGTLISIMEQFKKPILAVGTGESLDDWEIFNDNKFLRRLLDYEDS
jgi:fused signal recognition particle receptor